MFDENLHSSFCIILLTDVQTNKQTKTSKWGLKRFTAGQADDSTASQECFVSPHHPPSAVTVVVFQPLGFHNHSLGS